MPRHLPFEERFIIDPDTLCWNWAGAVGSGGYGNVQVSNIMEKAHRVAFRMWVSDPPAHLLVLHKCNNRLCVNPEHLLLGTHEDNAKYREFCGRTGIRHPSYNAKINPEIARYIRGSNKSIRELSKELGVNYAVIWDVRQGNTWKER